MDAQPQEQHDLETAASHPAPAPMKLPAPLEAQEGGVQAIIPRDLDQAQRLASGVIRSGIVPDAFKVDGKKDNEPNAPLILMGILKSMEVGLPPLTGLANLLPINNRFSIWGDAAVALVQSKRLVTNQTHVTIGTAFDPDTSLGDWPLDYGHEVRFWRAGQTDPYIGRFTVRDAKRAGLWMNSYKKPWIQFPDRMLFNRARAFALRDGFADALMGLGIAEEERDRLPDADGSESPGTKRRAALDDTPVEESADAPAQDAPEAEAREAETQ